MNKKLSIIIPVYQAEKYLENCVKSLQMQTYRNIEIILVDDGSSDSSPQICDVLSKEDSRIKVIHKKNQGPSSARNAGLKLCSGDYITFCDSDDELADVQIYEKCMNTFAEKDVEAVFFGANFCKENKIIETFQLGDKELEVDDFLRCQILKKEFPLSGYLWSKVYKKASLFVEVGRILPFDEEKFAYEDMIWILQSLDCIQKIALISNIGYTYYIRENSISRMRNNRVNIAKNGVKAYLDIEAYYQKRGQKKPLYAAKEMVSYIILMKLIVALKEKDLKMFREMKTIYYQNRGKIIYNHSWKLRIWNKIISMIYWIKFRKG